MEHYRNFVCYNPLTNREIITDTVDIFTFDSSVPTISDEEYLQQSVLDILAILKKKTTANIPSSAYGDSLTNAITSVSSLDSLPSVYPDPPEEANSIPVIPSSINFNDKNTPEVPRVQLTPEHEVPRVQTSHTHAGTNFKQLAVNVLTAINYFKCQANHIYNKHGTRETIDSLCKKDPTIWNKALSNEWGCLAQGNEYGVVATNTIEFIKKDQLPVNAAVTYASFVCDRRPLKVEPNRVMIVVGGDRLTYGSDAASPATDLLETKILLNSTISDAHRGAKFLSADLKDFFLASPMRSPEYMKVHISKFPPDIIQ